VYTIPWESKNGRTMVFVLEAWSLAFKGLGVPFFIHCFDFYFVSGLCMETEDSSMVIIRSSTDHPFVWTSLTNSFNVLTLLLLLRQQLWDPAGRLLYQPKLAVQDATDGPMGPGKILNAHAAVF
jgi:hypothetical protein